MLRKFSFIATFALLVGLVAVGCSESGVTQSDFDTALKADNGLGGFDYKLNIIGVSKDKTADMDDNNGRRIFVQLHGGAPVCVTDDDWEAYLTELGEELTPNPYLCTDDEWNDPNRLNGGRGKQTGGWDALDKVNKILLTPNENDEFGVLDANATDDDGAEFTMPDDVATEYKVYARALGKPGGSAAITLCGNETEETTDENGTETWCSINQAVLTRTKGKPTTEDVTDELFTLTILVDVDDAKDLALTYCLGQAGLIDPLDTDLQVADVPIFNQCFEDYFWNYDNNGLKLLQLRFFQVPSA